MKYLIIFLIATSFALQAQNERPVNDSSKKEGARRTGRDKSRVWDMMKEKYPEEFERLKALKETDPTKFHQELHKFFQTKMARRGDGRDKKFQGRDGHKKGAEHQKEHDGHGLRKWMQDLKAKEPKRFEELMALRKDNPQAFRETMMKEYGKHMQKGCADRKKGFQEVRKLAEQYRQAAPEDKEAVKEELREKLRASFEEEQKHRKAMAERLVKHLEGIQAQIKSREEDKEAHIEKMLERITSDNKEMDRKGPSSRKDKK